jgi:hypothetical protein
MKGKWIIVVSIIIVVLSAGGCAGYSASTDHTPLAISVDRMIYTPTMSSTVGIGLTPEYSPGIDNETVSFRWQTDYGYFLSWGEPDFKVTNNGQDVTTSGHKVYWSYSPDDMDKDKPPVHVTLTMVDKASGRALNTTGIDIGWESKEMAIVKK